MPTRALHAGVLPYYALIAVAFNAFAYSSMVRSTTASNLPHVLAQANSMPFEAPHAAAAVRLGMSALDGLGG